jgi:hypothetical protein
MKMTSKIMMAAWGCGLLCLGNSPWVVAQQCSSVVPPSTPTAQFVSHGNGTVTDQQTGLMWKQCLEGQIGSSCLGSPVVVPWDGANFIARQAATTRFAGYADWRLPSVEELQTIVERQCREPAINLRIFLRSPSQGLWSASEASYNAWSMDFGQGRAFPTFKAGGKYVRLVRNVH